jgi:hypothetical protein
MKRSFQARQKAQPSFGRAASPVLGFLLCNLSPALEKQL